MPSNSDNSNIIKLRLFEKNIETQLDKFEEINLQLENKLKELEQQNKLSENVITELQKNLESNLNKTIDSLAANVSSKLARSINEEVNKSLQQLNMAANRAQDSLQTYGNKTLLKRVGQAAAIFSAAVLSGIGSSYLTFNYLSNSKQTQANKMGLVMMNVWPKLSAEEKTRIASLADFGVIFEDIS